MRHEYENGEAKEVMTFREPEIPTYLKVMAGQKAANIAFYNDTELGRKYLDASKEWDDMSPDERMKLAKQLESEASHDDMQAFYLKDMAGMEQTLGLLESLEIETVTDSISTGSETGDVEPKTLTVAHEGDVAQRMILKNSNRRRELQNAHNKMFEDES